MGDRERMENMRGAGGGTGREKVGKSGFKDGPRRVWCYTQGAAMEVSTALTLKSGSSRSSFPAEKAKARQAPAVRSASQDSCAACVTL